MWRSEIGGEPGHGRKENKGQMETYWRAESVAFEEEVGKAGEAFDAGRGHVKLGFVEIEIHVKLGCAEAEVVKMLAALSQPCSCFHMNYTIIVALI